MKKVLSAILLIAATMFTSCRGLDGLDGRDGRDGKDGRDGLGVLSTVLIDVPQSSWNYSDTPNNNYFYATVKMPEITEKAFDEGLVKVYRVYKWDKKDASQVELPYTHMAEVQTLSGDWVFYSEMIDYEYTIGGITFFFTASDFDYELDESFVPDAMKFRCVVMY